MANEVIFFLENAGQQNGEAKRGAQKQWLGEVWEQIEPTWAQKGLALGAGAKPQEPNVLW